MNELALFAGAGGGLLSSILLGWRTVCAVEIDPYCQRVLMRRQDDGCLEPFPIWPDVRTFDGRPWRGSVDIITGGFPCQDVSNAGPRTGISAGSGSRSGLWVEMARVVCEVGPRYVFVENSAALTVRGLDIVLSDLAAMGYDARWGVFSAADVGARHERERLFILAYPIGSRLEGRENPETARAAFAGATSDNWWTTEPSVARVVHGLAHWVDQLRAIGNGQVPAVVRAAWKVLREE